MPGSTGETHPAPQQQPSHSRDLSIHYGATANQLLQGSQAQREATFRQFVFLLFAAYTFALGSDAVPVWQTMIVTAIAGLLGVGTMGAIQHSIERLQKYQRYLEPFQRGDKQAAPDSWLAWSAARPPREFVPITLTLRSTPLLLASMIALVWSFLNRPVSLEGVFWVGCLIPLAFAALFCLYRFSEAYRYSRADWEYNREHEDHPVEMSPKDASDK